MPRDLSHIRADIDAIDQKIVTSLFENGSDEEAVFESHNIKAEEIAQIRVLQLRFSAQAWNLINQRMTFSREVWARKKVDWLGVVIDLKRYEKVIQQVQSHAPTYAQEEIRKLYVLIHDISVRIQQEIISQP